MKSLKKEYLSVLYSYLFILAIALLIQFSFSQTYISIAVNHFHNSFADLFFQYFTYLGDGVFIVILGLLVMAKDRKAGLTLLIAYTLSSLVTQMLKHWVFEDIQRPSMVLRGIALHYVEGVEIHEYNSFPSGHSTSVFAAATVLCLWIRKRSLKLIILLIALTVCFSRIYLLQHFFRDTVAGSFIGFTIAFFVFLLMYRHAKE